jgi:transcriptional regulator with XRE-family HTH domain
MTIELETAVRNISKNLKYLRQKHNYTQLEVSYHLDLERKGYQNIESGKVSYLKLGTIIKILNFYNISFEELISDVEK